MSNKRRSEARRLKELDGCTNLNELRAAINLGQINGFLGCQKENPADASYSYKWTYGAPLFSWPKIHGFAWVISPYFFMLNIWSLYLYISWKMATFRAGNVGRYSIHEVFG